MDIREVQADMEYVKKELRWVKSKTLRHQLLRDLKRLRRVHKRIIEQNSHDKCHVET